ncbi:hypothetical protein PC116_g15246 [Phytophthora cactorum]|uniref:Uncharacterized protein n=1 Tax=Phytophthora cactorum TaxID=29920 RepID=A0A8T1CC76_9STRA|nr:hypothetical protein PC114_g19107 [Phytophthora cactorum]KAG2916711.1 hypothetical protein PC117_g17657 [Phytophthora cactorum]KAG3017172.1 hypothetical protein PC120_g11168 [Phytophthora cactorum]KAG3023693.1 hypothetical protein PC119_g8797 [Phytophthora cactorum]KAG3144754.1 hypothetical protein C6341_g18666 [Phytophthora cactorum]
MVLARPLACQKLEIWAACARLSSTHGILAGATVR